MTFPLRKAGICALSAVGLLGACTSQAGAPTTTAPTVATASASPTPAAATASAAPPVPAPGDVVTPDRTAAVEKAGLGYYVFADHTIKVVDPHAPLPADVIADLRTSRGPEGPGLYTTYEQMAAHYASWGDAVERSRHMRKMLVMIRYLCTMDDTAKSVEWGDCAYQALPDPMMPGFPQAEGIAVGRALNPAVVNSHSEKDVPFGDVDGDVTRARVAELLPTVASDMSLYEVIDLTTGW